MINNGPRVWGAWGPPTFLLLSFAAGCDSGSSAPVAGYQGVVEFEERRLGFAVSGRVLEVHVDEGQHVNEGALLAVMDDSVERAQTPVRLEEMQAAEQRAKLVAASSRPEEIRALQARIRAAQALEKQLAHNLAREEELVRGGATPVSVVQDLQRELERATAQRNELEQNLSLLRRGARPEERAAAQAQANASAAQLAALEKRLDQYQLHALQPGEVLRVFVERGEVVGAAVPVLSLADTSRPYADIFVPQAEITRLQVGQLVHVRVDGLNSALNGHIAHLSQQTEFTPRYLFSENERPNLVVRVRVQIEDEQRQLRAGIPAFVTPTLTSDGTRSAQLSR